MDGTLMLELLLFFCVPSIVIVMLMFDVVSRRLAKAAPISARHGEGTRGDSTARAASP